VRFRDDLDTEEIARAIDRVEETIREAEPGAARIYVEPEIREAEPEAAS
jgi:divalent metal cation (Fe/Co/Zn/Cd) transporter